MGYDPLIQRLNAAGELGVSLCTEAAAALTQLGAHIEALEKRHLESRADKLAAAYESLRGELATLRQIARYLEPIVEDDYVDFDLCKDGAKKLGDRVAAIEKAVDPDLIGAGVVAIAKRSDWLEVENANLTRRMAEAGGLGAASLLSVGIAAANVKFDRPSEEVIGFEGGPVAIHGAPVSTLTLRGVGRGAQYLDELFAKMNGRAK